MSYSDQDTGIDTGAPFELYEFVVPGSGLAWRYTNQPSTVTYEANTFTPAAISHGQITQQAGSVGSTTSIEVEDTNAFANAMLGGLSSRPVQVTVRQIHRDDQAQQAAVVFVGLVTGVSFEGAKATLPCGSRYALASKRKLPWLTYQAGCNWEWGGAGCGLNRDSYRISATLTTASQAGRTLTVAGAASFADGYFAGGWVEHPTTGETRFIEEHTGAALLLALPWATLSGNYHIYPGCQKNEAYCAGTFDNLVHYLGYPRLPSINPFNRSAYYQTGVADIPDPGDAWALPSGYQLVLSDQTATIDMRGGGIGYYGNGDVVSYTIRVEPTGYMYVLADGWQATIGGGVWLLPKNPPLTVPNLLDIRVDTPTINGVAPSHAVGATLNSWIDGDQATSFTVSHHTSDVVNEHTVVFEVRARDKASGLVRAAGTITIVHRFDLVSPGGA